MKKNYKWLINVATLVLCVCALAIGVYAAKQASLTATGTIGFTAHGLDLNINAYITGHATSEKGEPQERTQIATNKNVTGDDSIALSNIFFTDLTTSGEVEDIVLELEVTNNSQFAIEGVLTLPTNLTQVTYNTNNATLQLGKGATATMKITLSLPTTATSFDAVTPNLEVNFTKLNLLKTAKFTTAQSHDIDYVADSSYYYISMGSAVVNNVVQEVRWLPFAEKQTDGTWKHFDKKNKPIANKEYYFVSEYVLDASGSSCALAFTNNLNCDDYTSTEYEGVNANTYLVSNLRKYMKSTEESPAYRTNTSQDNEETYEDDTTEPVNLLTQYSLEDSYVYNTLITARLASELFVENSNDTYAEILGLTDAPLTSGNNASDKLWAMSREELGYMVNTTIEDWETYEAAKTTQFRGTTNPVMFWLRSPVSGNARRARYVDYDGYFASSEAHGDSCAARPAFQLTIPA
ncbi:MAG: hypothetical protein E7376_01835 [Clostridiales bacterium]|nr:hypothetical protein [Clostridiales bacterium]